MLYLPLHLMQSALHQKAEVKPGAVPRERSQGRPVMGGREVAYLPSEVGLRTGRSGERVSSFRAKFDLSASLATGRVTARAVNGVPAAPVHHAITSCPRNIHPTDEVLRGPDRSGRVSVSYKPYAKGVRDASVTGTGSPRPRLEGWPQRRSRGAPNRFAVSACSERQNLRVPGESLRFMGPVSPAIQATQWPGRTSSCQIAGSLRNSPQQPERTHRRFVYVRRNHHGFVSHCST